MESMIVRHCAFERLEDMHCSALVLYAEADGSGEHVEFQRAHEFDEQDARLGMQTYCIVLSDESTHYGGIERFELQRDLFQIYLSDAAQAALGIDGGVNFHLVLNDEEYQSLVIGFREIVGVDLPT